jgi:nucleoside-diphosphate kinase
MKTLLMIKPDTVADGHIGDIVAVVERNRFHINRVLMTRFTRERAEQFYAMHRERPFFPDLVAYITSGPVLAMEV